MWQNRVVVKDKKVAANYDLMTQLNAAIMQQSNQVLFDLDLETRNIGYYMPRHKVGLYNLFYKNIKKDSNQTLIKRNFAEAPIAYKASTVGKSIENMKAVLLNHGYYYASVRDSIVQTEHKVSVYYIIDPGAFYKVEQVIYDVNNEEIKALVSDWRKTTIKIGDRLSQIAIAAERDRISALLLNKGYYKFRPIAVVPIVDTNNTSSYFQNEPQQLTAKIRFEIRDSVNDKNVFMKHFIRNVRVRLIGANENTITPLTKSEEVEQVIFEFNSRDIDFGIIRKNIFTKKGDFFSPDVVDATVNRLNSFPSFRSVNVNIEEVKGSVDQLDIVYTIALSTRILSQFEINGSSGQRYDFGFGANYLYSDNNFARSGMSLRLSPNGGIQYLINSKKQDSTSNILQRTRLFRYDYGVSLDLAVPRFLFIGKYIKNIDKYYPRTELLTSFRAYNIINNVGQAELSSRYSYTWNQNKYLTCQIAPIAVAQLFTRNIDLVADPRQKLAFASFFIAGHSAKLVYNNKQDNFQYNYTYARLALENSGLLANALLPSRLVANFTYIDVEVKHYINSKKSSWVNRFDSRIGVPQRGDKSLPYLLQQPIGGVSSMRGWRTFALGPGSTRNLDSIFYNVGDIKLEANSELRTYLFPLFGFIKCELATFVDVGNIWRYRDNNNPAAEFRLNKLYSDIAVSGGAGIRFDFSFFLIRADLGVQMKKPYVAANNGWTIQNFRNTSAWRRENMALVVNINYPF